MSTPNSKNTDNISPSISNNYINYQKRKNSELFKNLVNPSILFLSHPQNYIPLYNRFFSLNETNYNCINLNNKWYLNNVKKRLDTSDNLFQCKIKNVKTEKIKEKPVFIKLAPLLDPFKFLVGKYTNINDNKLYKLPNLNSSDTDCHPKLLDMNNSAYIDGFFVYLSSILKNNYHFNHGLDYFGSFLAIKNNYVLNVFDDLEYLNNSEFFNKNKNILFKIDDYTHLFKNEKQKLKTIKIDFNSTAKSELSIKSINNELYENLFIDTRDNTEFKSDEKICNEINYDCTEEKICESDLEDFQENFHDNNDFILDKNGNKITTLKSNSTCSSRISYTNSELSLDDTNYNSEIGGESENDYDSKSNINVDIESDYETIDSEDEDSIDEQINVTISKFPVQLICMENCENTFDDLILNNELNNDEWFSALMQVIMILLTYQKSFSFTHNDLHTNNIMYNETSKEFITYCYNKKIYKIPTYGRMFKIIDFGRSIYKFQGKVLCSDSFQNGNDDSSQYDTEPYFDVKKL